jgi:hypothetical protein
MRRLRVFVWRDKKRENKALDRLLFLAQDDRPCIDHRDIWEREREREREIEIEIEIEREREREREIESERHSIGIWEQGNGQLYKSACSNAACSSSSEEDKINGRKGRPGPACRISGITGCLSDRQGCQAGRQG